MIRLKMPKIGLLACTALTLFCFSFAEAKKPTTPPDGGGSGGEVTALYDVLEIPLTEPGEMSEAVAGIITVAGENSTPANLAAAFVRIRVSDQKIVGGGFLPEPELIDPITGLPADVYSETQDVNNAGIIVGRAGVPGTSPNLQLAVVWDFDGTQYQLEELPSLGGGDSCSAVNNLGELVGWSNGRAVYWDPVFRQVYDLNTPYTASQGWHLTYADNINDAGQIVGLGILNGQYRGFLLDTDGQIYAVPLVGPAIGNGAYKIDEFGRIIGWAWDGTGVASGPDPDYLQAYMWDGPGTDATLLPSVTGANSLPSGMNDLGEIVGQSYIPGGTASDIVATLWDIDAAGQVTATDLNSVVDSTWTLLRGTDCNNVGWISVEGKRSYRGGYRWNTLLLIPRP